MAKPTTYSKRDNEKKKQEKRVEKQKKKETRKLNDKPAGFDDMIAYVDENGRISSTPPSANSEKSTKSGFDNDQYSRESKSESQKSNNSMTERKGRVEHVNAEKGYGFIKETSQVDKYFFHVSGLLEAIQVGDSVYFDLERGKKGYNAVRIRKQLAD